ncbi:hypothetical protein [Polyangium jinanense]|uniref:Uncharacterized protein n=1 Tax=Polyangium jinanense TaxID=2829994 RepID=A0A9X3XHB6_9BACT|nr:hypothetical protein [Polyangium jinanense]MDC3988683.1 hypothetical protein [Polyangium jinanense]
MSRIDLATRISTAAGSGLLRAYVTHKARDFRRVVALPFPHESLWLKTENCDEYGHHVGFRHDWLWFDPSGEVLPAELAALLETAPFVGDLHFRDAAGLTVEGRIETAALERRLHVFTKGKRRVAIIVPDSDERFWTLKNSERFGELAALWTPQGGWTSVSGFPLEASAKRLDRAAEVSS